MGAEVTTTAEESEQAEPAAASETKPSGLVEFWKPASDPTPAVSSADTAAWTAAEERAHAILDKRIDGQGSPTSAVASEPSLENLQGEELVEVFHRLVAFGMQPRSSRGFQEIL